MERKKKEPRGEEMVQGVLARKRKRKRKRGPGVRNQCVLKGKRGGGIFN